MNPHPFGVTRVVPWVVLLAVLVTTPILIRDARRLGIRLPQLVGLQAALLVAALVGAAAWTLAEWGALSQLGWTTIVAGDARRWPGGLLALAATLPIAGRVFTPGVRLGALADLFAAPVALGFGVVRLGCLLDGCCYGTPTSLPWALVFPPGSPAALDHAALSLVPPGAPSLPIHPLQLYFAAASLAVGVFLLWYAPHRRFPGELALWFLVLHETAKAALETFRSPSFAGPTPSLMLTSLALAAVAAGTLVALRRVDTSPTTRHTRRRG